MERWLRTDEKQEFISSVRMVRTSLAAARQDLEHWKWAVIALHNAMQGAMVMALRGSNNLRVMPEKLAMKCLEAHNAGKPCPKERLDSFLNLYEKVRIDEVMSLYIHSRALPQDAELDQNIERVLSLRNQFIHFTPQGWSIEVSGMPNICNSVLRAIYFLCWESGNITWYHSEIADQARQEVESAMALSQELISEYAI
ncbi:hypothetical protein ACOQNP_26150 [Ectopseudomonas khazarica]|uniref:hypothetical protein n=1 Tax=Ectopseudomonas khazarica TaxID=2502979 RepID=UPI0012DCC283